eukprot:TRINITY_DN19533_c0_g1_i1.p1 TRINITY_DN19533_c0_g1~~TRINITY_DN19533_c0_g1_i1.p1  ORF type:complete len:437 (+),score=127.15 TRINITY_DN19533_c0_g1_i1:23-1312(+)
MSLAYDEATELAVAGALDVVTSARMPLFLEFKQICLQNLEKHTEIRKGVETKITSLDKSDSKPIWYLVDYLVTELPLLFRREFSGQLVDLVKNYMPWDGDGEWGLTACRRLVESWCSRRLFGEEATAQLLEIVKEKKAESLPPSPPPSQKEAVREDSLPPAPPAPPVPPVPPVPTVPKVNIPIPIPELTTSPMPTESRKREGVELANDAPPPPQPPAPPQQPAPQPTPVTAPPAPVPEESEDSEEEYDPDAAGAEIPSGAATKLAQHLEMEARKREAAAQAEYDEPEELDTMGDTNVGGMPPGVSSESPGGLTPPPPPQPAGYDPYAAYGVGYYQPTDYSTAPTGYPSTGYPPSGYNPSMYPTDTGYGDYSYSVPPVPGVPAPGSVPPPPVPGSVPPPHVPGAAPALTPPATSAPVTPPPADSGDVEFF